MDKKIIKCNICKKEFKKFSQAFKLTEKVILPKIEDLMM